MKRDFIFSTLFLNLACTVNSEGQESKYLPTEKPQNILFWGQGLDPDLVLISQDDYVVIYAGEFDYGFPTDTEYDFHVVYSGIHIANCNKPLSDIARKDLQLLRQGELTEVKFNEEGSNAEFRYFENGEKIAKVMGQEKKLRIIEKADDSSHVYLDSKTKEQVGWTLEQSIYYLQKVERLEGPSEKWVNIARESCAPEPISAD